MNMMSKILSAMAISSMALLLACNHSTHVASKNLSASSDSKDKHPASTAVDGPVEVTCVSATDDSGNPAAPPACIVSGPGTDAVVDIGHKVAIAGAGNVTLSCQGKGALSCTARIDQ
jgi:hypothetical protein